MEPQIGFEPIFSALQERRASKRASAAWSQHCESNAGHVRTKDGFYHYYYAGTLYFLVYVIKVSV